MHDTQPFALLVLLFAAVGLTAVLSNRLTARVRVPAPALMLIAAAVTVQVLPGLQPPREQTVERLVTIALVCILFDGGMHIGWARFRRAAAPIAAVGVLGTFLTVAAAAVLTHLAFGLSWYLSILVATAVAPTDPAVVFSVLGQHQIFGRSGTILEGESGANDPVGIALMAALIGAGELSGGAAARVGLEFALQMAVGAAVGVLGGRLLLGFSRRVPLPSEGLYPLRSLACAFILFGAATLAHGSGFLAVFVAGIVLGDGRAPYKREVERFHSTVASLGEIVAFVVLGLTVDLQVLSRADVWVPGLLLGLALAVVIRPCCVGLCLAGARLSRNETAFVLFAGLKGAVPILLGSFILLARLPDAQRLYGIVIVVVVFSVVVQGSLVPAATRLLRIPTRTVELEPWALGVRLRDEPSGAHRFTVVADSPADRATIQQLSQLPEDAWISLVVRDQKLLTVRPDSQLRAGDQVLVLGDPDREHVLRAIFERPR
ncbi:MAG TPA: cation:proton antiporter [Dermatophilaceae bacterium]|nr:cation:proton antiporter [Dermatophilaceae bacterium]